MTPFSFKDPTLENKLIGNILREYPQMSKIMEKNSGGHFLESSSFKNQTLGMAYILFGVDPKRLLQEFEKIHH